MIGKSLHTFLGNWEFLGFNNYNKLSLDLNKRHRTKPGLRAEFNHDKSLDLSTTKPFLSQDLSETKPRLQQILAWTKHRLNQNYIIEQVSHGLKKDEPLCFPLSKDVLNNPLNLN